MSRIWPQALINPIPTPSIQPPSGPGANQPHLSTADKHGVIPRLDPSQSHFTGGSLRPWWPISGMTASGSLGTSAHSGGSRAADQQTGIDRRERLAGIAGGRQGTWEPLPAPAPESRSFANIWGPSDTEAKVSTEHHASKYLSSESSWQTF